METIRQQMKSFADRSPFSEGALASMVGVTQSTFYMITHDNYPHPAAAQEAKMEEFIRTKLPVFEAIESQLKEMTCDNYGETIPDVIAIRRMHLHRHRSELMNITTKKTGTRVTSTSRASLLVTN